jgi:thiol-disulfide isomerase/thioredoxin
MMRKNKILLYMVVISICMFICFGKAFAQQKNALNIGDPAPLLKYSKWIKGEPIASLTGDKLYVIEFWATWCGPCKMAMPHLTKLQQEYKDKVTFIGVNVWERVPDDKPYESSLPAVERFVKGNNANMGYSVIADNNERFMANNWMKAAGQNGIPASFIVKNNKILWIGYPAALDSILPKILEGRYNIQAFKSKFQENSELEKQRIAKFRAAVATIDDTVKAKEYTKAFELMEKVKVEMPHFKPQMEAMKFKVMLFNIDEKKAIEYAKKWQKEEKLAPLLMVNAIYYKDGLSKETYLWVANNVGNTSAETRPPVLNALAICFAKGDDYKNATIIQERALGLAKSGLKDGSMAGIITDKTIGEYEEKLKNYRSLIK